MWYLIVLMRLSGEHNFEWVTTDAMFTSEEYCLNAGASLPHWKVGATVCRQGIVVKIT